MTPPPLFQADAEYLELIMTNLINRSLYFLPPQGTLTMTLRSTPVALDFELVDQGYQMDEEQRYQALRRSPLFLPDALLQLACEENGVTYTTQYQSTQRVSRVHIPFLADLTPSKAPSFLN